MFNKTPRGSPHSLYVNIVEVNINNFKLMILALLPSKSSPNKVMNLKLWKYSKFPSYFQWSLLFFLETLERSDLSLYVEVLLVEKMVYMG